AGKLPLLRPPLRWGYERYFFRTRGDRLRIFSGIYPDFKAALRAIPAALPVGYDNGPSARRVAHDLFRIFPMDYPVMFWLGRLLPDCRLLFDWGGNIGLSYFGFRKHISYPAELTWLVSDVPAVVAEGIATAEANDSPGLSFTTTLERLPDADILLAAGAIHFIEDPLGMLTAQRALPAHLLFNKVPVYSRPTAVTLQNMGTAICPNHLFNEGEFVGKIMAMGYRMIDTWDTGLNCEVPFYPEHRVPAYKGYYFSR
ncbi:MAG: methyltransferase, TIGR04325 family, partial [Pseudomonadota bacterium]|nr:methyltransferase, TIGR04325 family [Pseudomonadota bacterium]